MAVSFAKDRSAKYLSWIIHRLPQKHCFGSRPRLSVPASLVLLAWIISWIKGIGAPKVTSANTARNRRLLALLGTILQSSYIPSIFTFNGHLNSSLGYLKKGLKLPKSRELMRTWDGGNVGLDWRCRDPGENDLPSDAPILLVIHGLNGHSDEAYVLNAMDAAHSRGWRAVAFNHRGCGGTSLTSARGYNGAFTGDIRLAVENIHKRYPQAPIMAAGYSLGANLLVKYLGEEGARSGHGPVVAAVSVSNPWDFGGGAVATGKAREGEVLNWADGMVARAYSFVLTAGLRMYLRLHKDNSHLRKRRDIDIPGAMAAVTLRDFDESVTVPMFGYEDLSAYHVDASSCHYLKDVKIPLLCINAGDDPLIGSAQWPLKTVQSNPNVIFVSTKSGGHIGWCQGLNPLSGPSWADGLISQFLQFALDERDIVSVPFQQQVASKL